MNNLVLYKRITQLKDYLENTEFEEFNSKQISKANEKVSEIFKILDRREVMRKRFGR